MENNRDKAHELVKRAQDSGYDTLMVTVDTAVAGPRQRDMRNGMTFPPKLTWKTFADASYKVEWWSNFLTTDDAAECMQHGAGGVILSNHRGRQLDRPPVSLLTLPEARKRLGQTFRSPTTTPTPGFAAAALIDAQSTQASKSSERK